MFKPTVVFRDECASSERPGYLLFTFRAPIFSFFLFPHFWKIPVRPSRISAGILFLVFLFGAGWEICEFVTDFIVSSSYHGGITDPVLDVVVNTTGSHIALLIAQRAIQQVVPGRAYIPDTHKGVMPSLFTGGYGLPWRSRSPHRGGLCLSGEYLRLHAEPAPLRQPRQ